MCPRVEAVQAGACVCGSIQDELTSVSMQTRSQCRLYSSLNLKDSITKTILPNVKLKDRSRRPEGGEWEPIKISSEIQTVGLYPENHPSPQAFWPKFGIAMEKLNQHKRPRTSERNHEANQKRLGKTADLICLDRFDRCTGPV